MICNSGCSLTGILNHLISFSFFQLVHFVNRDSLGLANDYLSLGFIPEGVDIQAVSDALQASFVGARQSNDFQVCTEIADFWLVLFFEPFLIFACLICFIRLTNDRHLLMHLCQLKLPKHGFLYY